MIIESIFKRFQMTPDIDTDTSYLNEPDAFEVNQHLHHWPAVRNPFIDRMALQLKTGFTGKLVVHDFMSLVAAATTIENNCVFEFSVTVDPTGPKGLELSFEVTKLSTSTMPPLTADNSGFFVYAMKWMATHRPTFVMSVYGDEFFWVHAQ